MISQRKIAEHLNLGRSTVANILRGETSQKYSEETRRAVLETAEKLGYRPNRLSRSIRRGRSNVIGVIHFGSFYEVARQAATHLSEAIVGLGYDLLVIDVNWYGRNMARALEQLVEARVEGVIICQMAEWFGADEIDLLKRTKVPVVSIAGNEKWKVPIIYGNSFDAFRQLVHHVSEIGHRRLLLLTNHYQARPTLSRIAGFSKGVQELGGTLLPSGAHDAIPQWPARGEDDPVTARIIRAGTGESPMEAAYQYARRLIELERLPDVILCSNDLWARGVFIACMEAGLNVPDDLALTGFDSDAFGACAPYHLTTVAQPIKEESHKTVEILSRLMKGEELEQTEYVLPCRLVVRHSCGFQPMEEERSPKRSALLLNAV